MSKNICPLCNTENEAEYKFCKNCGNPFIQQGNNHSADVKMPEYQSEQVNGYQNGQASTFADFNYCGVSAEEMGAFIGKKANDILPKFTKMELSRSKLSWCWPAAVLGFLFGPMGSALWFFYRKMYKIAVIFAVIGAVLTMSTSLMTVDSNATYYGIARNAAESAFELDLNGLLEAAEEGAKEISVVQIILDKFADIIDGASNLGAGIVSGIYGYYFYKKHCINKITRYRVSGVDTRFYKMGLVSIGGVSGGMLTVGIMCMLFAGQLSTYISQLIMAVI